jgi:hypothetical protein
MGIPVTVVDADGLRAWRSDPQGLDSEAFAKHKVHETGTSVFCWLNESRFSWICPSCGRLLGGEIGAESVSGWDNPRWVNSGTRDRPTLTPSLGCPNWQRGDCTGHYWLRDGELVQA